MVGAQPYLSIIIPALEEAPIIARTVLGAVEIAEEVIVVDGGSADATASRAQAAGARVLASPRGRGTQLRAGAAVATGAVLLFLHADAYLAPQARPRIEAVLEDEAVVGGNFRPRFASDSLSAKTLTIVADALRSVNIYFGDTAMFVRRSVYEALGGFAPLPLMEDYEFARRLERAGKTVYVRDLEVRVSARRFDQRPLRTAFVWSSIQALYWAGVPAAQLNRFYRTLR